MANIPGISNRDVITGTNFDDILNRDGDFLSYPGTRGNDSVYGLGGNDRLYGGLDDDALFGGKGDDELFGGAGTDYLVGDNGNDHLDGGTGADRMFGGVGDDTYVVDNVKDQTIEYSRDATGGVDSVVTSMTHTLGFGIENLILTGSAAINGTGNDYANTLTGNDANNVLVGGNGDDALHGMDGNDLLRGDGGSDLLDGGAGADRMEGGDGSDSYFVDHVGDQTVEKSSTADGGYDSVLSRLSHTLGFGLENLYLDGNSAINGTGNGYDNSIAGNGADNVLSGLDGDDGISGFDGNDQLFGGNGNDVLDGGSGNDLLNGGAGNDRLFGGTGVDTASYSGAGAGVTVNLGLTTAQSTGGAGTDLFVDLENLTGSSFNDNLTGNSGNNLLTGGAGNDTLNGGNGNDVLIGGSGRDQLNGGAGNDRFDYNAVSESPTGTGRDVITGFAGAGTALGDQIDLRDIDANSLVSGNQAFTYIGSAAFTAAGQLRYSNGILQGSTDGDTAAEFEIQLVGTPALSIGGTGSDILL